MYQANQAFLREKRGTLSFLIAAHRGIPSSGSVIQNTLTAAKVALGEGADIIELDIARSSDGILYAFHTGFEQALLGIPTPFSQLSSTEISRTGYLNEVQRKLRRGPERMDRLLEALRGKCLVNIDRAWLTGDFDGTLSFLESLGMEGQILVKAPPEEAYLSVLEKHACLYMPILRDVAGWDLVKQRNVNVAAAEIQWHDKDDPVARKEFLSVLHQAHVLTWANALRLSDDFTLSAWADDYVSLSQGPEAGWGLLAGTGFDIIQTDFPYLLDAYRRNLR